MRVSLRSLLIGVIGVGVTAVVRTMVMLEPGGAGAAVAIADIGEAALVLAVGCVAFVLAWRLPRTSQRRVWLLVSCAILSFAVGDIIWAHLELVRGVEPYPGLPDIFYMLDYVFFGLAMALAAHSMREGTDALSALLIAGLTCVTLLGVLYFGVLEGLFVGAEPSGLESALGIFYPIADVVLLVTPATFMLVLAFRTGDKGFILPWLTLGAGACLLAATDAGFTYLVAHDAYSAGSLIDYGWMIATVAMGLGVSFALDAAREPRRGVVTVRSETPDLRAGRPGGSVTPPELQDGYL